MAKDRTLPCEICGRPFTMISGDNLHIIRVGDLYKDGCNRCTAEIKADILLRIESQISYETLESRN